MTYTLEAQLSTGKHRGEMREAQVQTTSATASALEHLIMTEGLVGSVVVVRSGAEVQKIANSATLETIFVVDGPQSNVDSGETALEALQRNPTLSRKKIVLISEFPLDAQKEAMYRSLGATEVIAANEFEPESLPKLTPKRSRHAA